MTSQKVVLGLTVALFLAGPASAGYEYPAPGYFLGALTEQSSWDTILGTAGIKADFPYVAFGSTLVPLSSVCVDGDMLAIADPRLQTGVRVAADPCGPKPRRPRPPAGTSQSRVTGSRS